MNCHVPREPMLPTCILVIFILFSRWSTIGVLRFWADVLNKLDQTICNDGWHCKTVGNFDSKAEDTQHVNKHYTIHREISKVIFAHSLLWQSLDNSFAVPYIKYSICKTVYIMLYIFLKNWYYSKGILDINFTIKFMAELWKKWLKSYFLYI